MSLTKTKTSNRQYELEFTCTSEHGYITQWCHQYKHNGWDRISTGLSHNLNPHDEWDRQSTRR